MEKLVFELPIGNTRKLLSWSGLGWKYASQPRVPPRTSAVCVLRIILQTQECDWIYFEGNLFGRCNNGHNLFQNSGLKYDFLGAYKRSRFS